MKIDNVCLGGDEFAAVENFIEKVNDAWDKLFQELLPTITYLNEKDQKQTR